jgi:hypothetical protein
MPLTQTGYLSDYARNQLVINLNTLMSSSDILGLFQNNVTPTPATTFAELVECNFPGYSAKVATISWSRDAGTGNYAGQAAVATPFNANASTTPAQTAYGWFLTDSNRNNFLGAGVFMSPTTFANSGDGFSPGAVGFLLRPGMGQ